MQVIIYPLRLRSALLAEQESVLAVYWDNQETPLHYYVILI